MPDPILKIPTQGWRQILTPRKEMLDAFDKARDQAKSHEVETYHGKVAEAEFRKWLTGFLPKRFGVTSGYIVSAGLGSHDKIPHFDVIIFDALESPILWIENNPDSSDQGRSRAIPVEYVKAVFEVKSRFKAATVRASIEHLRDLTSVMDQPEDADQRYKFHLPVDFRCGLVFFELAQEDSYSKAAMDAIMSGFGLRGFFGGVILRGEGITMPHTGRISLTQSDQPTAGMLPETPLFEIGMSDSVQIGDKLFLGALLHWSEAAFSQFAFDLLAMLQGTYRAGYASSFYGLGSSFDELMRDVGAERIDLK